MKVICSSTGLITIKASAEGNATYAPVSETISFTIGNLQGQEIIFPGLGQDGGLRHLPLGRRPFILPKVFTSAGLRATLEVTSGADLVEVTDRKVKLLGIGTIEVTATHGGGGGYYAAAPFTRSFEVKEPGRGMFFSERRLDGRHGDVLNKFKQRLRHMRPDLSLADAAKLFDEDSFDSDGDGVSNLLERAFGMDSLGPDSRKSMPRTRHKNDGKQRITFVRYQAGFNTENIEYKVELSTDLRVWSETGVSQVDDDAGTPGIQGVDIGGGMERVTFVTDAAVSAGERQYLRLSVSAP